MDKKTELDFEPWEVARAWRLICNDEIEKREDQLPSKDNPKDREELLKEIDALHELADQANERANELIEVFRREHGFKRRV
tara:strand:- start:146 stop:388 length:243 start_codon:yes stop_codon:yes gene_type:complete